MKVCYFGTYRANYARNEIMIASLRAAGVEVIECHVPLWHSIEDRVQTVNRGWASLAFFKRIFTVYKALIIAYRQQAEDFDVMVLGYPGQLDVFLARLLTWIHRKPLALDLFMSIYLIALERNLDNNNRLSVLMLRWIEKIGCHLADLLISDTTAYMIWHCETHGLRSDKFGLVPTGYDEHLFHPYPEEAKQSAQFTVFYYGTFIPNHGVNTIIEAANLLKDRTDITFELAGDGPTKQPAEEQANAYELANVHFSGWVDHQDIPKKIAQADIVLGVFGVTPQSMMTVQNKIYESLAVGSTVISGISPTMCQQFEHKEHIYLIERKNGVALAEAILALKNNPELSIHLRHSGQKKTRESFNATALGNRFKQELGRVCR